MLFLLLLLLLCLVYLRFFLRHGSLSRRVTLLVCFGARLWLTGRGGKGDGSREGSQRCSGAHKAAGGGRHRKPNAGDGTAEGGDQSRHVDPRGAGESSHTYLLGRGFL